MSEIEPVSILTNEPFFHDRTHGIVGAISYHDAQDRLPVPDAKSCDPKPDEPVTTDRMLLHDGTDQIEILHQRFDYRERFCVKVVRVYSDNVPTRPLTFWSLWHNFRDKAPQAHQPQPASPAVNHMTELQVGKGGVVYKAILYAIPEDLRSAWSRKSVRICQGDDLRYIAVFDPQGNFLCRGEATSLRDPEALPASPPPSTDPIDENLERYLRGLIRAFKAVKGHMDFDELDEYITKEVRGAFAMVHEDMSASKGA